LPFRFVRHCDGFAEVGDRLLEVMALFGYPQAQENDAERAVLAALRVQRALADLDARNVATGAPELSVRIGLESGPVVTDAAGEVFGEAPNIARHEFRRRRSGGRCWSPRPFSARSLGCSSLRTRARIS
jgi:hypothetical protein